MASFNSSYHKKTAVSEGHYGNREGDRGGETYKGLARNYQPTWPGWSLIDEAKQQPGFPENLEENDELQRLVVMFYRGLWDHFSLDAVTSQVLADEVFDAAVNQGPPTAARFLQESLNVMNCCGTRWPDVREDGRIGPQTVSALMKIGKFETYVTVMFIGRRINRYFEIMHDDPSQEEHARSWMDRLSIRLCRIGE